MDCSRTKLFSTLLLSLSLICCFSLTAVQSKKQKRVGESAKINEQVGQVELNKNLFLFLQFGDIKKVAFYITQGADLNAMYGKVTALAIAISSENIEIIKLLIKHGAYIPKALTSLQQAYPEEVAKIFRNEGILQVLLDTNYINDIQNAFEAIFVYAQHTIPKAILRTLLKHGIHCKDKKLHNTLIEKAFPENQEIIAILQKLEWNNNGFQAIIKDKPESGTSIIVYLAAQGCLNELEQFLQSSLYKQDVDSLNRALEMSMKILINNHAITKENREIFFTLLKNGAQLSPQSPHAEKLLLWIAGSKEPAIVQELIRNGVNINITDPMGNTPLKRAILNADYSTIEALLNAGATVNNALDLALSDNCSARFETAIIDLLDKHGAQSDNYPPYLLSRGIAEKSLELVRKAIALGANINHQYYSAKLTPLHMAAKSGDMAIFNELIKYNPKITLTTSYQNPLHFAIENG
ncbi:MAG TPA: ankyrin repeat domain-containing protein, partial [Candidatus Babeliaceae bacterium]|nr:ankyrin repeat domain-containing protein [Candidatus Babeliaceae bacterium]